jgi:hypothetical protein
MNAELDPRDPLGPLGPLGPSDGQIARMRANVHATIAADQSRTRRRRGWTIGGAMGLLVILAGGTSVAMAAGVLQAPAWFVAAPAPTPTATHEPVTVTTPTPTPSATPIPTPVAFNLPCDRQFDPAVLSSIAPGLRLAPNGPGSVAPPTGHGIGPDSVSLMTNAGPPMADSDIAAAQSGFYTCAWFGGDGPIAGVTLSVLPNGARTFATDKTKWEPDREVPQIPRVSVGDDSVSGCWANDAINGCEVLFVDGGLEVAIKLQPGKNPPTAQRYAAGLTSLANSLIASISESGARPTPAPGLAWPVNCDRIERDLSRQFPGVKLSYSGLDHTDNYTPLVAHASELGGGFWCLSDSVDVAVVPGAAAWAWSAPFDPSVTVTPLSTAGAPGVDAARYGKAPWGGWVDGVIDGAIVTVTIGDLSTPLDPNAGLKVLAAIAAG